MELVGSYLLTIIETGGFFAPLLFIIFHLLRPLFFLPVVFICISGGILFGTVAGTIYSIIGITLSSALFYGVIQKMPQTMERFTRLKGKLLGKHTSFTTTQITFLRLVPFIHFHLLSLCLFEISNGFKEYTKVSFMSSVPLAMLYTTVGGWLSNLSPFYLFIVLGALLPLIYIIRTKEITIKWDDFFEDSMEKRMHSSS